MKSSLIRYAARFDALQLRERWLVALALVSGIVLVGYSFFVEPAFRRAQLAQRNVAEQGLQLAGLQAQSAALQAPGNDPDVAARAELARLTLQLDALAGRMKILEGSLVPPQRMASLLEDMIGPQTGLRLLSLKTLPVAALLEKPAGAVEVPAAREVAANPSAELFKHGVEIRLEGSYQELAAYLERLEQSKKKLLWSNLSLSADNHPRLVLTLTVYTLSLGRTWLIV